MFKLKRFLYYWALLCFYFVMAAGAAIIGMFIVQVLIISLIRVVSPEAVGVIIALIAVAGALALLCTEFEDK